MCLIVLHYSIISSTIIIVQSAYVILTTFFIRIYSESLDSSRRQKCFIFFYTPFPTTYWTVTLSPLPENRTNHIHFNQNETATEETVVKICQFIFLKKLVKSATFTASISKSPWDLLSLGVFFNSLVHNMLVCTGFIGLYRTSWPNEKWYTHSSGPYLKTGFLFFRKKMTLRAASVEKLPCHVISCISLCSHLFIKYSTHSPRIGEYILSNSNSNREKVIERFHSLHSIVQQYFQVTCKCFTSCN